MTDQPQADTRASASRAGIVYSERLTVPLWWWPPAYIVLIPIAFELHMAVRSLPWWLAYVVILWLPAWIMLWLGRRRIEVTVSPGVDEPAPTDIELRVGRAHLPSNFVGRAAIVPAAAKSAALGRQLDPAAFVAHRAWVGSMVLLVLDDPDDPTPYWLISTRKPEHLLAVLGVRDDAFS